LPYLSIVDLALYTAVTQLSTFDTCTPAGGLPLAHAFHIALLASEKLANSFNLSSVFLYSTIGDDINYEKSKEPSVISVVPLVLLSAIH
jgi:hypothetical protein